jgi:hypothetical protein
MSSITKSALIVGAALLVAGCLGAPKTQLVAQCKLDALRLYPSKAWPDASMATYIQTCMDGHGYRWNERDKVCAVEVTRTLMSDSAQCYRRRGVEFANVFRGG